MCRILTKKNQNAKIIRTSLSGSFFVSSSPYAGVLTCSLNGIVNCREIFIFDRSRAFISLIVMSQWYVELT